MQEKQKTWQEEIRDSLNGLFEGELSDTDELVYVNGVITGKMLEDKLLVQQAMSNTKEQFANSPDLANSLLNVIMDVLDTSTGMSSQYLRWLSL